MLFKLDKSFPKMLNRRVLFRASAIGLMCHFIPLSAKAIKTSSIESIYQQNLPNIMLDNWIVRAVKITFPAGGLTSLPHRHPGFVLGYILKGSELTSPVHIN